MSSSTKPRNREKEKERVPCNCNRCLGALVCKKTFRNHNPEATNRRKRNRKPLEEVSGNSSKAAATDALRTVQEVENSHVLLLSKKRKEISPEESRSRIEEVSHEDHEDERARKRLRESSDQMFEFAEQPYGDPERIAESTTTGALDLLKERNSLEGTSQWDDVGMLQGTENELARPPSPEVGIGDACNGPCSDQESLSSLSSGAGETSEDQALRDRQDILRTLHLRERLEQTAAESISETESSASNTPDPDEPLPVTSTIETVRFAEEFVSAISVATLDGDKLDAAVLDRLRNPQPPMKDRDLEKHRLSLDLYLDCKTGAEDVYNSVRATLMRHQPGLDILSLYSVRQLIETVTGISPVYDDMCIDGCCAYVAFLKDKLVCFVCGKPRYLDNTGNKLVPYQQACTIPLGPQLQALKQSKDGALAMQYRARKMQDILDARSRGIDIPFDDIFSGSDLINLGKILDVPPPNEDDILIGLSIDGAQLYQDKKSDTWFGIWIVYDYDPLIRYKRRHILPAFIIPGPEKPKNVESFLFRSLYHLSALQRENSGAGFKLYDALKGSVVTSRPFFVFGTADTVGLVELDGRVGHQGAKGCRLGCPMKGRHKPNVGVYNPAHLKPNDYTVDGCDHPDYDFRNIQNPTVQKYRTDLKTVAAARTQTAYEKARRNTGICKPTLISGLRYALPPPKCFTVDLMHHLFLNIPVASLDLWRGVMKCDSTDTKKDWDWVVCQGKKWEEHGKLVDEAKKYTPSWFDHFPRNPALKLNSGFKATEFKRYFFELGPVLFRTLLPDKYYQNYIKLVRAVQILVQKRITLKELQEAHKLLIQYVEEFEHLYYQRRADRLHFCRPCIHTLLHLAKEVHRVGPGAYTTQYTLEGTIGLLTRDIRQHSTPFANVIQIGVRRSQYNALQAIYPQFAEAPKSLPEHSKECGNGYILLPPRSESATTLHSPEQYAAIFNATGLKVVRRWGKIILPNGQTIRSRYQQDRPTTLNRRVTRMVKLQYEDSIAYGEIQFFFHHQGDAYALASLFSEPNTQIHEETLSAVSARHYLGNNNLVVVKSDQILTLVSMQPLPPKAGEPPNLWVVMGKLGVDELRPMEDVGPDGEENVDE
ncbi:hypothetical protein CC2G_006520 [Coprinopsis cinerea AmutBmut pab1-1]|nr:hypothetical protein CC2G_006520 [Coprinopsis cinerea AmutBmut pab1-1]